MFSPRLQVVRAICHTQVHMVKNLKMKKAHIMEIQINGGKSASEKVDFAYKYFEKVRFCRNDVQQWPSWLDKHGTPCCGGASAVAGGPGGKNAELGGCLYRTLAVPVALTDPDSPPVLPACLCRPSRSTPSSPIMR